MGCKFYLLSYMNNSTVYVKENKSLHETKRWWRHAVGAIFFNCNSEITQSTKIGHFCSVLIGPLTAILKKYNLCTSLINFGIKRKLAVLPDAI